MTKGNARPRDDESQKAGGKFEAGEAKASVPRAGDRRTYLIRRADRRELDALAGVDVAPVVLGEPIDWSGIGMDLGVPERDRAGRELALAGWAP